MQNCGSTFYEFTLNASVYLAINRLDLQQYHGGRRIPICKVLAAEQKPLNVEQLSQLELGNVYDSNKVGKIGYERLEEAMKANTSLEIINNATSQGDYEWQKEIDYWNRQNS